MKVVDVHAHLLSPSVAQLVEYDDPTGLAGERAADARRAGPLSAAATRASIASRLPQLLDPARRLSDMHDRGIDRQIVSPSPSQYYTFASAGLADRVARSLTDAVADLVAVNPRRLGGFGSAALQHPALLAAHVEAAKGSGLAGVEIPTHANTPSGVIDLGDDRLEDLWSAAEDLGAWVFIHPFACTLEERLSHHHLATVVGHPAETALALSHIISAGVLDRHPQLKLLAAHGGGYLPMYSGRSDRAWSVREDARGSAEPPSTYLRRIYYDGLVHDPVGLRELVGRVGSTQVMMGSDYPFEMGDDDPVGTTLGAGLSETDLVSILGGNAARMRL